MRSTDVQSRVTCPHCQRRLTIDPETIHEKFQCPKCLNTVDLQGEVPPSRERVAQEGKEPEVIETEILPLNLAPRESDDEDDENHAEPPDDIPDDSQLAAENQRLRKELETARSTIEDTAHLVKAMTDLEQRLYTLAEKYVKATTRLAELERRQHLKRQKRAV